MKTHTPLAAIVMAVALAGSIAAVAAQDDTDHRTDDKAAAPVTLDQPSPTTESPSPVATVPLQVQMPLQPVAVENVLSEMKIYPSF